VYQQLEEMKERANRQIAAGQLERGGKGYGQYMFSAKIVKTVLKSRFYAISSDFNDFTRFQPDFTHFRVL
jgi:hypothetical protein